MFPLNGHNVTWPQHRRDSMSNSRQLCVNPHQFGLEGSDWIHNNELLVRLRTSLGLPSEGVLKISPKIPHWGFSKCICHRHCICLHLCCCLFVGQVMFSHRSDQMSQRPKVSKIALWRCSLNVFVIVIVFLFVFVFVVIFLLVRSCFLITLIKCLKGQKSQRLLFEWQFFLLGEWSILLAEKL